MIDIFTTGGTIDKVYFDALSEFQIGPAAIPDMLRENNVHVPHRVTQLMRKDSLELTDADREAILAAQAATRGLRLEPEIVQYLLRHGRRDLTSLLRTLDALDAASLERKRAITLPLLREILQRDPTL